MSFGLLACPTHRLVLTHDKTREGWRCPHDGCKCFISDADWDRVHGR